MGCDISAAVERWGSEAPGPACWRFHQALTLNRNYHLFSILAGVRRDHEPIAPPRGLPTDLDPESCTKPWHKDPTHPYHHPDGCPGATADFGDHSYSWLLLSELRAYDWDKRLIDGGCIPLRDVDRRDSCDADYTETYTDWIQRSPHRPKAWCRGLSNAEILDLRPREFLVEDLSSIDKWMRDTARRVLEKRGVDEVKAQRYLADPRLFPEVAALTWTTGNTNLDRLAGTPRRIRTGGEQRPLSVWAHVAWSLTARETCREFCTWLDTTQDLPGDEVRIVIGFSG